MRSGGSPPLALLPRSHSGAPFLSVTATPALGPAAGACWVLSGARAEALPGRGTRGELTVLTTSCGSNLENRSGRSDGVLLFLFKVNCCLLAPGAELLGTCVLEDLSCIYGWPLGLSGETATEGLECAHCQYQNGPWGGRPGFPR